MKSRIFVVGLAVLLGVFVCVQAQALDERESRSGLEGQNIEDKISRQYIIDGSTYVGGLIGDGSYVNISRDSKDGLEGVNLGEITQVDPYVSGTYVGGLVSISGSTIYNTFTVETVEGIEVDGDQITVSTLEALHAVAQSDLSGFSTIVFNLNISAEQHEAFSESMSAILQQGLMVEASQLTVDGDIDLWVGGFVGQNNSGMTIEPLDISGSITGNPVGGTIQIGGTVKMLTVTSVKVKKAGDSLEIMTDLEDGTSNTLTVALDDAGAIAAHKETLEMQTELLDAKAKELAAQPAEDKAAKKALKKELRAIKKAMKQVNKAVKKLAKAEKKALNNMAQGQLNLASSPVVSELDSKNGALQQQSSERSQVGGNIISSFLEKIKK